MSNVSLLFKYRYKLMIKKTLSPPMSKTFLVSSSNEYFDDCPVCRAMKKAVEEGRELSRDELEEAFVKANTQN